VRRVRRWVQLGRGYVCRAHAACARASPRPSLGSRRRSRWRPLAAPVLLFCYRGACPPEPPSDRQDMRNVIIRLTRAKAWRGPGLGRPRRLLATGTKSATRAHRAQAAGAAGKPRARAFARRHASAWTDQPFERITTGQLRWTRVHVGLLPRHRRCTATVPQCAATQRSTQCVTCPIATLYCSTLSFTLLHRAA
jgi:hypothetical protein